LQRVEWEVQHVEQVAQIDSSLLTEVDGVTDIDPHLQQL